MDKKQAAEVGKPETPLQRAARKRNWSIRQLRAFYHLCPPNMSQAGKAQVQDVVDRELRALGAETETARQIKRIQNSIEEYTFDEQEAKKC